MTFFGRSDGGALSDIELAAEIADGAGRILQSIRHGSLLDDGVLGDTGDRLAQAWPDPA